MGYRGMGTEGGCGIWGPRVIWSIGHGGMRDIRPRVHRGIGIGDIWPLGVSSIRPVRSLGGSSHSSPIGSGVKEHGSIGLVMPMLVCPYPLWHKGLSWHKKKKRGMGGIGMRQGDIRSMGAKDRKVWRPKRMRDIRTRGNIGAWAFGLATIGRGEHLSGYVFGCLPSVFFFLGVPHRLRPPPSSLVHVGSCRSGRCKSLTRKIKL